MPPEEEGYRGSRSQDRGGDRSQRAQHPLGEISRNEIKALCFKKADSGLAGRSVHYIARTMSAIFNQAIEDGIISSNPAARPGRYVKGDIDWNGKFIEIRRASWNRIVTTPKNGKSRRVDMSDQLAQVLSERRSTHSMIPTGT